MGNLTGFWCFSNGMWKRNLKSKTVTRKCKILRRKNVCCLTTTGKLMKNVCTNVNQPGTDLWAGKGVIARDFPRVPDAENKFSRGRKKQNPNQTAWVLPFDKWINLIWRIRENTFHTMLRFPSPNKTRKWIVDFEWAQKWEMKWKCVVVMGEAGFERSEIIMMMESWIYVNYELFTLKQHY